MSELKAYQVGDCDVVAAYTPESAVKIMNEMAGNIDGDIFAFSVDDTKLVSDDILDSMKYYDLDEAETVYLERSLRQDIALMTEEQYAYGWE